ncbi:metallophosphoesterase [Campylobacter sp. RM12640]|uniref:UDP-2,3-diacylglucosamine diphosphatase n=1 Tax=unclassified Campylobacter TaxID=2593542 RepID=UPI0030156A37|nr:metallophosphoesterase [Campylobacter sp. RM12640]MBZ7988694.1 metallophosphoesterase [Campylobacter sp. RM12635]
MLVLKEGAVFIADVHYDSTRLDFVDFIDFLKKTNPPQVILLGDIFNLLIGGISSCKNDNLDIIKALDDLALKIEIIYFEGNHDFNLTNLFKNVKIIKNQPILATYNNKIFAISHGDIFLPIITQIVLRFLRFSFVIFILNLLNILSFDKIYQKICNQQKVKKLYKKLDFFKKLMEFRIKKYKSFFIKKGVNIDYIIEGHFHQGDEYCLENIKYKNLEAFANDRSFFILEYGFIKKYNLPRKE